ncbi:hypothetical protein [Amycolatopsis sp. cg9]|uniref:hypothetical protein n=1 Tax=Amycolatopsis sp. cg9 TaxID=3238801 RepID=UPI0035253A9D
MSSFGHEPLKVPTTQQLREKVDAVLAAEKLKNSLPGRARAAYEAGEEWFQISIPLVATGPRTSADRTWKEAPDGPAESAALNAITSAGWRLESLHTTFAPVVKTPENHPSAGAGETVHGWVMGTYLFSRGPGATPPP